MLCTLCILKTSTTAAWRLSANHGAPGTTTRAAADPGSGEPCGDFKNELGFVGELAGLVFGVDERAVDAHIEYAAAALDELCGNVKFVKQSGRQTDGLGLVVSLHAVSDRDIHFSGTVESMNRADAGAAVSDYTRCALKNSFGKTRHGESDLLEI